MKDLNRGAVRRASFVLAGLAAIEGGSVLAFHNAFLPPLWRNAHIPGVGWIAASIVALVYIAYGAYGLAPVREHLLTFSFFKLWGPVMAVPSAILEEVFFRQSLMNAFAHHPLVVQIAVSAAAFGLAHAVWAFKGGSAAFIGAVGSTTALGIALSFVFVLAGRSILPCVLAHFLINVVLEPWLVYAYALRASLTLTQRQAVA